ncbi:MAG: glycosyltransferase [Planctomycetes bacterium]|nr:glycosyltransferase [Planctomycetota bacterium]
MSQPRQILHLISSLDGYGQSKQLRQLVERQAAEGCQVRIVALTASFRERLLCERAGAVCRVLLQRWQYDPIVAYRLARELRQPHDLLHVWGLAALRYANFARPATTAAPCIATLAQLPPKPLIASADRFVFASPQKHSNKQTVVIPPGVGAPTSDSLPHDEFLELLSLPADARIVGMAGQLTRGRGLEEAIWCFELVRTLDERARLLIFGSGPDRHRLERFSRLASEPSAIRFLGYQENLERWLPHVEVFWQLGSEPPPLAALEAMASQVPVVATDVQAHRQIIEAGRTGFLFPVASRAICARHTMRLLKDPEIASTTAKAAAEEVSRRFSRESFFRSYKELYNRLACEPRP